MCLFSDYSAMKMKPQRRSLNDLVSHEEFEMRGHGHGGHGGHKKKYKKKYKKFLLPLLLAYKLKFFTLIPLLIAKLILLMKTAGMAGFFFALFAGKSEIKFLIILEGKSKLQKSTNQILFINRIMEFERKTLETNNTHSNY